MKKLVLFLLVGFSLISLSAGNEEDNELVKTENIDMMEHENLEMLELAEPEAISKKKKGKKGNKKRRNKKNKKKGKNKNKKKGNKKNKKKGNKKNKKKGNKKNKKKGNKKNKKKENKKNKKKGNKKNKNNRKKGIKNKGKSRSHGHTSHECAKKINTYLFFLAKQVINLDKQIKRANNHKSITKKKHGKKGDYAKAHSAAHYAAGGKKSAPKCGGNSTNAGAMKFKEILDTLSNCSKTIHKECQEHMPAHPTDAEIAACKMKIQEYWWKMGNNTNKTDDLCGAFGDNDTDAKYTAVKDCMTNKMTGNNMTIKDWSHKVTKAKKDCITAFANCRKEEREVGPTIQTCSQNKDTLVQSLNALTTNNKSASTVKDKVKSLTSNSSGRHNREVPTNCSSVSVVVLTFTMKLDDNPEADVSSETSDIAGITLADGHCSTDTELSGYLTTLETIITDFIAKITILQTQLTTITGSTASSAQIAAATTASSNATTNATTVSSRRKRREYIRKILNEVK